MDPSDIVERLLDVADLDARAGEPLGKACREAAAEIERLRAALASVKEQEECCRPGVTSSNEAMMAVSATIRGAAECDHDMVTYQIPEGGIGERCKKCGETITIYR